MRRSRGGYEAPETTFEMPPMTPAGPAPGARPTVGPTSPSGASTANEAVDHPPHYNAHPSGVECIDVVEHMGFNLGNAIKYVWRADLKGDAIEDLRKARWYLDREIARRGGTP